MDRKPIILIVEDSGLHQRYIADVLEEGEYHPEICASAEEAIEYLLTGEPRLIILDLGLPGISGFEFLEQVRQISSVPILMLTVSSSIHDKLQGFELGADDYVTKPFNPKELIARIEAVLRRSDASALSVPGKQEYHSGDLSIDYRRNEVKLRQGDVHLTATEFSLLSELVQYEGRVLSHEHLLRKVWGEEYDSERDILRTNIYRLRKKLEPIEGDYQFIRSQVGFGYWFEPYPER